MIVLNEKRNLLIVLVLLVFIMSCGKSDNKSKNNVKNDSGNTNVFKNEKSNEALETEKYNKYVDIYNKLMALSRDLDKYFRDTGTNQELKDQKGRSPFTPYFDEYIIKDLKKNLESPVKMGNIDKISQEFLPVLDEIKKITDEVEIYYQGKDYLNDKYAKAKELHKGMLQGFEKYKVGYEKFKAEIEKMSIERKNKDLEKYKKEGFLIRYNLISLLTASESFLIEMENQKIDRVNFINANPEKFKALQAKISEHIEEIQKVSGNEEQLKKEGFDSYDVSGFIRYATEFKGSVNEFVNRIETKKGIDEILINNDTHVEIMSGTPENVFKKYNEMIGKYNDLQ